LAFTIKTTWEGKAIPENETVSIGLKAVGNSGDILMAIDAPFYDDPAPAGEPGQPFLGLWDYEVVEAFFLNDNEQYLEVEVSPHGQHIVLLLNGTRNDIKTSLPLNVTTKIVGSRWTGEAIIPRDYFPPKVSKIFCKELDASE
ncbi:UNVERIFIED_CONTAM: hypothetical protein GTU68_003897, partial [Idotea baltica]|nr:hypothetical protein [Idotea baltica]